MDEKIIRGYETLVCDVNDALKRREKFKNFVVGDRHEQDYILSNVIYFKAYHNYTDDNSHYLVLKRDIIDISTYPNLQSDMKRKFIENILREIEEKI